jgi:hypothetical protein
MHAHGDGELRSRCAAGSLDHARDLRISRPPAQAAEAALLFVGDIGKDDSPA